MNWNKSRNSAKPHGENWVSMDEITRLNIALSERKLNWVRVEYFWVGPWEKGRKKSYFWYEVGAASLLQKLSKSQLKL